MADRDSRIAAKPARARRDGWTPERQLAFLDALARTRSVSKAAECAGMSREGAYRLRSRAGGALFALLWDRALAPADRACREGHRPVLTDGRLARILGYDFRRKAAASRQLEPAGTHCGGTDRTRPS